MMTICYRFSIAIVLTWAMLSSCSTPQNQGNFSQHNPCPPDNGPSAVSPGASFVKKVILNPLANIGGTLLATAAANYSQQYTGKLNKLLTKLVTPKVKKKKRKSDQEFFDPSFQQTQPEFNTGFPQPFDPNTGLPSQTDQNAGFPYSTDPNTGFPIQLDPNTGLPVQSDPYGGLSSGDQQGLDPGQFPADPYGGLDGNQPFVQQDGFDPNIQGGVQPRGMPGQYPHVSFPANPCYSQTNQHGSPAGYPQNQFPDYTSNLPPQGQVYNPYGQQPGLDPYGQTYPSDPYAQQAYPTDPYAQQPYPSDPYAQQGSYQNPNAQGFPQQDPYAQQSYPQDSHTQLGNETGIPTQGPATPIGLDVVMVKKSIRNGVPGVLPFQDGEILKDGRGHAAAGDKFRIMFRPHTDGYVYVIAIDGSGWAQGIFPPPTSPLANPVKAGDQYVLPEGNNWFSLDQFKGVETIFFVASQEKRQDIEEILQSITGRERPASERPQQVTRVAMVPHGVGGTRPAAQPFSVSAGSEADQTIIPTSYLAQQAGQDLRLTRWFRHE